MAGNKKRGRPRQKSKIVYSPVDGTTVLPYARKDAQGNYYFSWRNEKGKWIKKNLGRGSIWYQKYLQYEAQFITNEPYVVLPEIIPPNLYTKEGDFDVQNVEEFEATIDEDGTRHVSSITPRFQLSVMVQW